MDGFFLLLGHFIGDYILQNDWMASNKTKTIPWRWRANEFGGGYETPPGAELVAWQTVEAEAFKGHIACTVHCLLYTLAVWACSFWWMPVWGVWACFAIHWPIDRYRLAGRWMWNVSGQAAFASGPLAPWSVIVVDNIFHLLTLGIIAALAGRVG